MNNFNYAKLTPFKWYLLQNFPFIEADFDALTNWQLFCKLGKEMNKIIDSTNQLGTQVENLTDYVANYFENLDVQEEINNKLDEMAEGGQLEEIIAEYLNTQAVLGFNTVANMKSATNLINGGICKTLGETNRMDGNGAFYKIRTLTSGDTIDEINIISLTNFPTLIAELIPYTKMKQIIQAIPTNEKNAIYFGNSFLGGVGSTSGTDGIFELTKDLFNNAYKFTGSGTGFLTYTDHDNDTFLTKLNQAISSTSIDKNTITDIIVVGAWGDTRAYAERGKATFASNVETAVKSFVSTVKTNYPNASRISYIWAEGRKTQHPSSTYDTCLSDEFDIHNLFKYILPRCGMSYLGWIGFNITLNETYFDSDPIHPNDDGYAVLASSFKSAYCGNLEYKPILRGFNKSCNLTSNTTLSGRAVIYPDKWFLTLTTMALKAGTTASFNTNVTMLDFSDESWCLPIPFTSALTTNYPFGTGFNVQVTRPDNANFNPANAFYARFDIRKTATGHSTILNATSFSASRTVPGDLSNATINPNLIYCDLEWR